MLFQDTDMHGNQEKQSNDLHTFMTVDYFMCVCVCSEIHALALESHVHFHYNTEAQSPGYKSLSPVTGNTVTEELDKNVTT